MTGILRKLGFYARTFRSMNGAERRAVLRRVVPDSPVRFVTRKVGIYFVRAVEIVFGAKAANAVFWRMWSSVNGWRNTERRLTQLALRAPETVDGFVEEGFRRGFDVTVLNGFVWNRHSRAKLAQLLAEPGLMDDPGMQKRVSGSQRYAAVLVTSAARLLDEAEARRIATRVYSLQPALTDVYFALIDSAGTRLAQPPTDPDFRGILQSGFRTKCAHRLIITDDHAQPESIVSLFHNAERVTLIALSDTFGKADFAPFMAGTGVKELIVEHIRSRATRFSHDYIVSHRQSRDVALAIGARLRAVPGLAEPSDIGVIEVAVADLLHFQSLRIRAVELLLADTSFDHIVIATDKHDGQSPFIQGFAGVAGLASDPRVEVISISDALDQRARFGQCLASIVKPVPPVSATLDWAPPLPRLLADLESAAQQAAGLFPMPDGLPTKPVVQMFTTSNTAYNASTVGYAAALAKDYKVTIVHAGANALELEDQVAANGAAIEVLPVSTNFATARMLNRWLQTVMLDEQSILPVDPASYALRINVPRIASAIHAQLILGRSLTFWYQQLAKAKALPDIVIVAPQRAPQVMAIIPVARRNQVPSLTLEAHGLNANYSRYLNIGTDYYGVIAEQFRASASADFKIEPARTAIVGTPRIVAPKDHDPAAAQAIARKKMTAENRIDFDAFSGTVSFFCQPSAWEHMEKIVGLLIRAAERLDLQLLLKAHPEEAPSRVAAYRALAKAMGAQNRMRIVNVPPQVLVAASDVVLTAYSAAALDAAIQQVPVVCLTSGDVDYPVDQHSIVGAPLVRNLEDLTETLRALRVDPEAARKRAGAFLTTSPQFVSGPAPHLMRFVQEILATPAEDRLRPADSLPDSYFLAEPHPVFPV